MRRRDVPDARGRCLRASVERHAWRAHNHWVPRDRHLPFRRAKTTWSSWRSTDCRSSDRNRVGGAIGRPCLTGDHPKNGRLR